MENFTTPPQKARRLCKARTWAFAPFLLVFVACNPPGAPKDDGGSSALQSWVTAVNSSPILTAGNTLGNSTNIELTFDRKLQKVTLKNAKNEDLIEITLTRKISGTENNVLVFFRVGNTPVPAPASGKPNRSSIDLANFSIADMGAVDTSLRVVQWNKATLQTTFPEMTFTGTRAGNNLRAIGFPRLKSGDKISLTLNAGALTAEDGTVNEPQSPSIFARTIQ